MNAGDRVKILSKPNGIKMFEGVVNINNCINIDWAYHGSSVKPGDIMNITDQYTYEVIETVPKTEVVADPEPDVDNTAFAPSPAPVKKISKRRR